MYRQQAHGLIELGELVKSASSVRETSCPHKVLAAVRRQSALRLGGSDSHLFHCRAP